MTDPDRLRGELLSAWEQAAPAWGSRASALRDWGMPVSSWMLDHLQLQPGQRVLELAAGTGDTGFLAAEIVAPGGGIVISSDGAEAMVDLARRRAGELGVRGVEFRELQLEWIDLPTADVDGILCRWGLMLVVDPATCLQECRRVLRPGGRIALAVWDIAEVNPWMTLPRQAVAEASGEAPARTAGPGPFALASADRLRELLAAAGFTEIVIEPVELERRADSADAFLAETLALSKTFSEAWEGLDEGGRERAAARLRELSRGSAGADGQLRIAGRSLVAAASA